MNKEILEYLKTHRVGVLAVEMMDGSPHASTVHFANSEDPLVFFFETSKGYRKAEPLLKREKSRASFVVGTDEKEMKTFQLDGEVKLIGKKEQDLFNEIYFKKFPEKINKKFGSTAVYFSFTPTWWRFTDWKKKEGKSIYTSDDSSKT